MQLALKPAYGKKHHKMVITLFKVSQDQFWYWSKAYMWPPISESYKVTINLAPFLRYHELSNQIGRTNRRMPDGHELTCVKLPVLCYAKLRSYCQYEEQTDSLLLPFSKNVGLMETCNTKQSKWCLHIWLDSSPSSPIIFLTIFLFCQ